MKSAKKKRKISRRMKTSRTTNLYAGGSTKVRKILNIVSFSDETWFTFSRNIHNLMTDVNINGSPQAVHEVHFHDLTIR
jgi:hypothetical protein